MNALDLESVHFESANGTDLTVGLAEQAWINWQPLYSPKWLQQRSLEALRLQPLGRTSAVF